MREFIGRGGGAFWRVFKPVKVGNDWCLRVEFGKIGKQGQARISPYPMEFMANDEYERRIHEKTTKKDYVEKLPPVKKKPMKSKTKLTNLTSPATLFPPIKIPPIKIYPKSGTVDAALVESSVAMIKKIPSCKHDNLTRKGSKWTCAQCQTTVDFGKTAPVETEEVIVKKVRRFINLDWRNTA